MNFFFFFFPLNLLCSQRNELHKWKVEKEHKLEEARQAKAAAMEMAENEKAKTRAAMEAIATANRITEMEARKRKQIETASLMKPEDKNRASLCSLAKSDRRYREYTIDEIEEATENFSIKNKIGEGGYGPVYKGTLDYTKVAIKVLRPDAKQGRSQFQQEVEVLTSIRHPNLVLLLGACSEYGCLVYEYLENGSVEDCLLKRGNSPVLSWQLRFRIASEIATSLNFLHQMKPEPVVHRDLKPANILLDQHMVSKVADVGLARLVPPSVSDTVTQYRVTSAAGTLCYIDPEYQQTGMLGTKSDIYSFGITLLQILTGKPPMSLTHKVQKSIEQGTFAEILDPDVPDWPLEEALVLAKIGLRCAELRRKDRPNLRNDVLPELKRLMDLAEESMSIMRSE